MRRRLQWNDGQACRREAHWQQQAGCICCLVPPPHFFAGRGLREREREREREEVV